MLIAVAALAIVTAIVLSVVAIVLWSSTASRSNPPKWLSSNTIVTGQTSEYYAQSNGSNSKQQRKKRDVSVVNNSSSQNGSTGGQQGAIYHTTVVLSSNPNQVQFLIVNGNLTVKQLLQNATTTTTLPPTARLRKRRDVSGGETSQQQNNTITLADIPFILVTADPYTGAISSFKSTPNCSDSFINAGMVVSRSLLTNQNASAYATSDSNGASRKRRSASESDCSHTETIDGNVYCPQFSKSEQESKTVLTKVYTSSQGKMRSASTGSASPISAMDVKIDAEVDSTTGHLTRSTVTGNLTLVVSQVPGNLPQEVTLTKNVTTDFNVKPAALTNDQVNKLQDLMSGLNFTDVKAASDGQQANNISQNGLTRQARSISTSASVSKDSKIDSIFGKDIGFTNGLSLDGNFVATSSVNFHIGNLLSLPVDITIMPEIKTSINRVLNLFASISRALSPIEGNFSFFENVINTNYRSELASDAAGIQTQGNSIMNSFLSAEQQVLANLAFYNNSIVQLYNSVGPAAFPTAFMNSGLQNVDFIFAPYQTCQVEILKAIQNISTTTQLLRKDFLLELSSFIASEALAARYFELTAVKIGNDQSPSNCGDMFDWSFFSDGISALQNLKGMIDKDLNQESSLLNSDVQSSVSNLSAFDENSWLQVYNYTMNQIALMEAIYGFSVSPPNVNPGTLQMMATQLKAYALVVLNNATIQDIVQTFEAQLSSNVIQPISNSLKSSQFIVDSFLKHLVNRLNSTQQPIFSAGASVNFPCIGTPIGGIFLEAHVGLSVATTVAVVYSSGSKFVASVTPAVKVSIGGSAGWSVLIFRVGASVDFSASVGFDIEYGMTAGKQCEAYSGALVYTIGRSVGLFWQYGYIRIKRLCLHLHISVPCGIKCHHGCRIKWCAIRFKICIPMPVLVWSNRKYIWGPNDKTWTSSLTIF